MHYSVLVVALVMVAVERVVAEPCYTCGQQHHHHPGVVAAGALAYAGVSVLVIFK